MRFFCLFFVSFIYFFILICFFLVWKFDVLFVGLLVVVFYGHSKQTRSLLLLDLYNSIVDVQSVTLIIGFIHGQRIVFTLRTAEVKVSFMPIH